MTINPYRTKLNAKLPTIIVVDPDPMALPKLVRVAATAISS